MTGAGLPLDGLSFLIVEDQYLIARELSHFVQRLGGTVVGPAPSGAAALDLLAQARPDCVLLDVELDGERSYTVAAALQEAGIPFAFTTGYDRSSIDPRYHSVPYLQKPVAEKELAAILASLTAPGA